MKYKSQSISKLARALVLPIAAALTVAACEKVADESSAPVIPTSDVATCALILNEGGQGSNNATLSRLDLGTGALDNSWFADANGSPLGDVAQDLVVYGAKAYVSVFGSGCLWAIDTATGLGHRLDLGNRGPRYIAAHGGSLYITCYRPEPSVIRVDTATFSISGSTDLGAYYPEGIAISGDRLFVASSWAQSVAGITYDSLLYVLDIATMRVDTTLVVGFNPQKVLSLRGGKVATNCWGKWNTTTWVTEGDGTAIIDAGTLAISQVGHLSTNLDIWGDSLVGYARTYSDNSISYFSIDPSALTTTPLLPTCTITNPYSISASPDGSHLYITTDGNYSAKGDLHCYSSADGSLLWSGEVGWFPSKIVFY